MERNPHLLIEGCAIACYAIGAKVAYIYIRGEFYHVQRDPRGRDREGVHGRLSRQEHLRQRLRLRRLRASRRRRIRGGRGDGAHRIARRQARAAAAQAAVSRRSQGLYQCPTAVNNVETLCNVPLIVLNGAEWFAQLGPEKNGGPKLYCVSGHVKKPGVYEASMNTTLARADLRLRGRHPRRSSAEGDHSGRIVGAAAAPRPARHARQLRRHSEGRLAARFRRASSCSTTPSAWCGSR